jgi:carbamoyltransferase
VHILGIADNHDASAALVSDGRLVAACGQERIDRIKNSGAFPWGAIDATLDAGGIRARDVDRVVFGTAFTPSWLLRRFPDAHHKRKHQGQFDPALNAYIAYQVGLRSTGLHMQEAEACRRLLHKKMKDRGFVNASVDVLDHHMSHAQAAYRSQPHASALVITVDAMGDGRSATASVGRNGLISMHWSQSGFAAVNTFYSRITEYLGFTANRHEGKVTGLAALATPPPGLLQHMRTQLRFVKGRFSRTNYLKTQSLSDPFYVALKDYSREEVAAAAQGALEEAVCDLVRHHIRRTGIADVAVCGGVFANVKLNQRLAELDELKSLSVFPNMSDGGLAVGAAMASAGMPPQSLETAYLGPSFDDENLARSLATGDLRPQKVDVMKRVLELLEEGKVVARFDGAMEFGPRALGNRSLLLRPDDPSANQWLNARLKRSEFMPFAPLLADEDAEACFVDVNVARDAARFMTVCFQATESFAQLCPGVVHVDGSARPQLLRQQDNPVLHELLVQWKARTFIPALVNTSFNLHEEPIVCTPGDAVRAFKQAELDALWMGPYLVERPT